MEDFKICDHCNGTGFITEETELEDGDIDWIETICGYCDGFGEIYE